MDATKQKKLEAKGWKVGSAADFLGLDNQEQKLVDIRLALAKRLKKERQTKKVSQATIAKRISSSQSRVAKMEAADRSVSVDLLIRSLVGIGVSREEIGKAIAGK